MVIGHTRVVSGLERHLYPVTLLVGPPSVGKRTIAEHVAAHHGAATGDVSQVERLDADAARWVIRLSGVFAQGPLRVVIIRLDGAQENAANILLKSLEEPPPALRFILLAPKLPYPPTLTSRAVLSRCGFLTDREVAKVLQLGGMDPASAAWAAPYGHGQVRPAMEADTLSSIRGVVIAALRATAAHDMETLERALKRWDDAAHDSLIRWAYEAASGKWRFYSRADSAGLDDGDFPYRLLVAASASRQVRPRLAATVALEEECMRR